MYSATFTFAKGDYDDDFHRLDQVIAEVARSIPGYVGEEAWENPASGLLSNVYYWETLQALQQLMDHPRHVEAKRRHARWIQGYHVVVAQVLQSHGSQNIGHPLAQGLSPPPGAAPA